MKFIFKTLLFCLVLSLAKGLHAEKNTLDTGRYYTLFEYNFVDPASYKIKNIQVEEANNKPISKSVIVIYSGLSIGQTIRIPGSELPKAIENIWALNYYSDVQVFIKQTAEKEVILNFVVKEQPRLSRYKFWNVTNGQAKSLKDECGLKKGIYITPNLVNRTKNRILKYFWDKGYYSATVSIKRPADTLAGYEKFDIYINKGPKVKVYDFDFNGNANITDAELRKIIKKPKRRYQKINIFASSKFIADKFEEQKTNIVSKYLSKGFRDARILSDSISIVKPGLITVHLNIYEGKKYYFRNVIWKGNIKFRTTLLDTLLGVKKGDVFNQSILDEKLYTNPSGYDVTSLYMDDGYLFFQMQTVESGIYSDSIDLEIRISEGPQARVGNVSWTGNTKTNDRVILRELRTKPGDIFSRAEIQRTMRDLAAIGLFNPAEMNVNPKPNPSDGTVDIEYKLVEKPSDQIELSGGWGGSGLNRTPTLLGTAGVSLNNFSTRKLFKPKLWNPVPTGDGQKLSVRANSNGSSYQGYTFSFTEPWLGGKKPNSLSISLNHTVNAFDFLPKTNPDRKVFFSTSAMISLGKRLKWPDDFFSIQNAISLQQYNIQNLTGGIYGFPSGFEGKAYNFSFESVISRNSISDNIYPMSGSSFTATLSATPPYSLIGNKNFKDASPIEKYKWTEYYKIKFDAEWYTTLYKKLVFMTKARFGFLNYYNKDIGQTFFGRYQVGGSGIFGFNLAATEIISQRGYENYTISQTAMNSESGAPIFNKFTAELRYAITQGQTATVYCLAFAEAGDAWRNMKNYNPFQLKRSAGVGVRLFMPMFGLIGLDWAYGFDWKNTRSSKPGQIHFFIGQQF